MGNYQGIKTICWLSFFRPDSYLEETVASGLALIRRCTELNQAKQQPSSIISRGDLLINVDYHKVFINAQVMEFPWYEFNLLCLLASSPGRVFTNEQLYRDVWGEDYLRDADNGLHSCLNRIRRKISENFRNSYYFPSVRGRYWEVRGKKQKRNSHIEAPQSLRGLRRFCYRQKIPRIFLKFQ